MDAPRIVLLIFLLLFLFASPDTQRPSLSQQRELEHLLADERQALDLLNSTQYGDFDAPEGCWINVTGLRQDDKYAWDLLPRVQERARKQQRDILAGSPLLQDERSSTLPSILNDGEQSAEDANGTADAKFARGGCYENVTGIIRGHWVRSKVADNTTPPILNLTSLVPRITYSAQNYNRNITGRDGNLRIKLEEKGRNDLAHETGLARELRAEMTIKDESSSGDGWEMTLHGVHYPRQGGILLATTGQR
jgi:transmembrane E3 ubiquitin-protein ligase